MSGYAGGQNDMSNGNLDSLFAQLRQQSANTPAAQQNPMPQFYGNPYFSQQHPQQTNHQHHASHGYQHPSVSSPLPTPPMHGHQPHHTSAVMSPASEASHQQSQQRPGKPDERTNNLLNLLKFSQPSSGSASQPASNVLSPGPALSNNSGHNRAGSGNDLIAALMGSSASRGAQPSPQPQIHATPSPQATFRPESEAPPSDTQAYLLQLLNRPKPAQSDASPALEPSKVGSLPNLASPQQDLNDLAQALKATSIENPKPPTIFGNIAEGAKPTVGKGVFTYVNPFEQLAASSPRNRTPKAGAPSGPAPVTPSVQILKRVEGDNKRKVVDERTETASPAHTKRKVEASTTSSPTQLPDGRTRLDALMGIGAPSKQETTVAQALSEMGNSVDQQVEDAIIKAEAEEAQATIEKDLSEMLNSKTDQEFETSAQATASGIQKELEKAGNEYLLEETMPAEVAEAVREVIDDAAQGHVADDWENDATDEPEKQGENERAIKVYNLPMKPFISLTLKPLPEAERANFRDESLMDIARLKKEFDQIDRTLVTSTNHFIVYCMSKNGGIRVIRQEDGKDLKLFTETHDRVFSVAVSASEVDLTETIIGTGISGTVYWAAIKEGEVDHLSEEVPEQYGFALPPLQTQDEGSPGGMLKTRARKSSSHPDFFAVGRGRSIHIIWPSVIMKKGYDYIKDGRTVDTEKYLGNRSLKINTGKAGKDFTFSQDDTTIVSLDKAGRVKFWDVRTLTNTNRGEQKYPTPEQIEPVEIKDPLMTLLTTAPNEKSWPTSVLFVDKLRPYQKGGALRYLIIGMKQNHTLQLWDLALGKPVQELHLPHEKESDAVCSVMYHASTGIIVVGHPTRNSIYLIHLSSPKYNLSKSMSQAEFTQKLVNNDPSLPKPDSTAVMSGIREYSFASKGQLRSLDILQNPSSSFATAEDNVLFELYAMHSKGVTCLAIKHEDLGWNAESKVLYPVDALKAEAITVEGLKPIPTTATTDDRSEVGSPAPSRAQIRSPEKSMPKEFGKKFTIADRTKPVEVASASTTAQKAIPEQAFPAAHASSTNGQETPSAATEKVGKNKKKKAAAAAASNAQIQQRNVSPMKIMKNSALETDVSAKTVNNGPADVNASQPASLGISQAAVDATIKALESSVSSEVNRIVSSSLESLYKRIDDDKRAADAISDAKQDAMLRLVSSTLSDNVQKTLAAIVNDNISKSVVPAISTMTTKAVNDQLAANLKIALPKELKSTLPEAISKSLQKPELLKSMSESLARSVAFKVEENFATILHQTVTPAFTALAVQTSQKVAGDIQRQANEQIAAFERSRQQDSMKIEQLTKLVTGLSEMVSTMATAQTKFQGEFLKVQQQVSREKQSEFSQGSRQSDSGNSGNNQRGHSAHTSVSGPRPVVAAEPAQKEDPQLDAYIREISSMMNNGDYENAIVRWLQTGREQEIYVEYFSKFNASFAGDLSPLLLLSTVATVTAELEGSVLMERMAWLETCLQAFQPSINALDDQTRSVTPKIMGILRTRLENLFMRVTHVSGQDPLLKRLSTLINTTQRINDMVQMPSGNAW